MTVSLSSDSNQTGSVTDLRDPYLPANRKSRIMKKTHI